MMRAVKYDALALEIASAYRGCADQAARCQRNGLAGSRTRIPLASRSYCTALAHQPALAPPGYRSWGRCGTTASRISLWVRPGAVAGRTFHMACRIATYIARLTRVVRPGTFTFSI